MFPLVSFAEVLYACYILRRSTMMQDPYTMLLQMIAAGDSDEAIARATGWPVEAVETLRIEVECAKTGDCNE